MSELDLNLVNDVVSYFNANNSTVRKTAKHFGISKSTVHKYITKIMPNETSLKILEANKLESSSRGGKATAIKNKSSQCSH